MPLLYFSLYCKYPSSLVLLRLNSAIRLSINSKVFSIGVYWKASRISITGKLISFAYLFFAGVLIVTSQPPENKSIKLLISLGNSLNNYGSNLYLFPT